MWPHLASAAAPVARNTTVPLRAQALLIVIVLLPAGKVSAQLEQLKRRVELLDIFRRAPNENRALKFRIHNLEKEVSLLRQAAKK
jgi:hypothetical protein